jgi:hypothetical protein
MVFGLNGPLGNLYGVGLGFTVVARELSDMFEMAA